ncbi:MULTISPECIES: ComEC/Rec2 family competence protein [Anoxynatronum]|uniref:Competence protein ComEC n=2 Tax=Anoxynatronum TaxID=210622 RepID=A0AA45WSW3_9CLOT|nr:ComEC/Rec2 family competence protein [Anoxynatronum buryatiense]SMP39652.1 competence protein ComEC [Anoxynatronum buryatiense]
MSKFSRFKFIVPFFLIGILFIGISGRYLSTNPFKNHLSVHLIDVGQGDSLFIRTPSGTGLLIDAGDASGGDLVAAYLKRQGIRKIPLVVATHPHADHIGGMETVLTQFDVDTVYLPPVVHTSRTFESLLNTVESEGQQLVAVTEPTIILDEENVVVRILTTGHDFGDHLNNWSLWVHVTHGQQSFLFTGDAEQEAELLAVETFPAEWLRSTVLKAGHHGSNTSSTQALLEMVSPEVVLISCGRNNAYGHPHKDVISRLEALDVWIYRTDLQGHVTLYSDGTTLRSYQAPANALRDLPATKPATQ